jgi:large subunit ribosomal protein L23
MNQYDIILRPIVTDKIEIAKAVEQLFKVKVLSVQVMNMEGKARRLGKSSGKRPDWRKAIVKIGPKDKISFFEGV